MTYHEIIRRIRGDQSKADFARLLGVSPMLVTFWEQGRREPGKDNLAALFNLAAPPDKVALARAVFQDPNLEIIEYEMTPEGVRFRRLAEQAQVQPA